MPIVGFRAAVVALVALLVAATVAVVGAPTSGADALEPGSLPVIEIHGYDSQDCPGSDASYGLVPFNHVMREAGWTGPLLPVSFYACDYNGVDITGYGPDTPGVTGTELSPDTPRVGYRQDASFVTIARDLAWFIYRNFSASGRPVDIVSLSMGGLLARIALQRVQAADPSFPPLLRVAQSITFSTPHRGLGTVAANGDDPSCHHMVQCEEFGADSPVMTELMSDGTAPQGAGGTEWTVIGSSAGCDFMPLDSALGLRDALQIDLTAPCYSHVGYFWDIEPAHDATAVVRTSPDAAPVTLSDAPHSLTLATILLQNPRQAQEPEPEPVPEPEPEPVPVPVPLPAEAIVTALPAVTTTAAVPVQYRSSRVDASTTFDLRYRVALGNAGLSAWVEPASMQGRTELTRSIVPPARTTQFCVAVRVRDGAGVSPWSAATCTAVPIDDRSLTLSSGWSRLTASTSFAKTLSRSTNGAAATTTVLGRGIAVIATTCPTCGSLQISVAGKVWRTISTASRATVSRVVLTMPAWPASRTAAVTLRATSTRPVYLDGLAVLR